jgi:copper(I)-binding protein
MHLRHFAAAAVLFVLTACDSRPSPPQVTVEDARVQLPAVPGRPGAAYFTLVTNIDPTHLVSIASSRVERIELHGTTMEGSMAKMRPLDDRSFAGRLVFGPGGKHAMLFGIDPALKPGDKIPLTFTFDPAPPVTVGAEVTAFGEDHGRH